MYCSQLLVMKNDLPQEELELLDDFLRSNQYNPYITISMAYKQTGIPVEVLADVFCKLSCVGTLNMIYAVSCPECGHIMRIIKDMNAISEDDYYCNSCEESVSIDEKDVVILYEQKKFSFHKGQYHKTEISINTSDIAPSDNFIFMKEMSETFQEILALKKDKYENDKIKYAEQEKISKIKGNAMNTYRIRKIVKIVVKLIVFLISALILWRLLLHFDSKPNVSALVTVATYLLTSFADIFLGGLIETDYAIIEKEEILKYDKWKKKK